MNPAALVFSHSLAPRLQYVIDFLSQYYGLGFKVTSDEEKYLRSTAACKINYSYHRLSEGEIFIHSHALLFETSVRPVKVECFEVNGRTAFFKGLGDTGFDLLAAVFYLLSRYEEYLPHQKDAFGRYAHQNALAFREGFLDQPLVNLWLEDFRPLLAARNPEFGQRAMVFSFAPTYDIDIAWSFRNKGFRRNAGAMMLLLLQAKLGRIAQRIRVLRKKRADPYDAYDWMDELHRQYGLKPLYFFLVAKEKGKHDKNIDVHQPAFQSLVKDTAAHYPVGLHPSWISGDVPALLTKEKATLEAIIEAPVSASRQHFLRFTLPTTFRRLATLGIMHDHSMGYGSINGFRASVATPFFWYDLKNEERTNLLLHPFCFMDANACYEQRLSPEAAAAEMMQYAARVKAVDGTLATIWHNSFLGTDPAHTGWREAYAQCVAAIAGAI